MSGPNGINEWEDDKPSREFLERLSDEMRAMEILRHTSNRDLARRLYQMAEMFPQWGLELCEAADRIIIDIEPDYLGEN